MVDNREKTKQKRCPNILFTTEYDPDYVIRMADGSRMDLCDGSHIVTFQDNLLALSSDRQQRLGIHLLAANTGIPVTILEHPTLPLFKHILTKEHYDYVGFSTIVPALEKIEKMIQICREVSPHSRIIIGGHGVEHGYATRIGADLICRGEGIAYMQKLLGSNVEGFRHPTLPYHHTLKALRGIPGISTMGEENIVVCCGAGCPMGCEYCPASSFYDQKSFKFLDSESLLSVIFALKAKHPKANFFFWDQDFLLDKKRVHHIGEAIYSYNHNCTDGNGLITWSAQVSVRSLSRFDFDDLFRYGCRFLSIGVESSEERWEKRKGQKPERLFDELHCRGIGTFAFFIIGWESHDAQRVEKEIDYLLSLDPTVNHFTLLTPEPGTKHFKQLEKKGGLLNLPPRCFNYATLQFKHPYISADHARVAINNAYKLGTQRLGATILRVINIAVNGLRFSRKQFGPESPAARAYTNDLNRMLPVLYLVSFLYPAGVSASKAKKLRRAIAEEGIYVDTKSVVKIIALNIILFFKAAVWRFFGVRVDRWHPAVYRYENNSKDEVVMATGNKHLIKSVERSR
jgi:hypothetical protein